MAFDRLIVDGESLVGPAIIRYFDELVGSGSDGTGWAEKLRGTALQLLKGYGLNAMTSGTTGPPKRLVIAEGDLLASAHLTAKAFGLAPGDRVLHCLPGEFIAGQMMLVRAFALGLDVHFCDPRGSVLGKLKTAERFRFAAMVPLQLHRALQEDRDRVERMFETILLGGGPVSDALVETLEGLSTAVHSGYGSTETVTHVALRKLNGPGSGSHFSAIGDCHFARDPRGCLVVYTPHLVAKQHVTNDLVELIDDTHFRWLGRYDNVILSGGKKVYPEQLEARTARVLAVPHYFSGATDAVLGQAIVLNIESDRSQEELVPEVMDALLHVLQAHEMPRRIVVLPRIERTGSGKIKRSGHEPGS